MLIDRCVYLQRIDKDTSSTEDILYLVEENFYFFNKQNVLISSGDAGDNNHHYFDIELQHHFPIWV